MLTESFVAATLAANKPAAHLSSSLKDVGIFQHELQPQSTFRQGFKKSSVQPSCLAVSNSHIFAAQAEKAVINVYSREKGNQEATVPFPERIRSLAFAEQANILVIGSDEGRLSLWEVATGRISTSAASHLQGVTQLCLSPGNDYILSGSPDSTCLVWSLPRLVSFEGSIDHDVSGQASNAAVGAFSAHRNPITAITCGYSKHDTNFAVSASEDQTCYVWHIETCQILRTVLLPSTPLCVAIDPADRALYFGDDDGAITLVDILSASTVEHWNGSSSTTMPSRVTAKDVWKPSSHLGSCVCMTLSYDGTSLLTGHANGSIVQWDVAKRRMATEITNVGQPVTNISMLRPDGLPQPHKPFIVKEVVKPKLELNTRQDNGTCGIPARYNLHATLLGVQQPFESTSRDLVLDAITKDGWPDQMLDDAVRAIEMTSEHTTSTNIYDRNLAEKERLEDQVSDLKKELASLHSLAQKQ